MAKLKDQPQPQPQKPDKPRRRKKKKSKKRRELPPVGSPNAPLGRNPLPPPLPLQSAPGSAEPLPTFLSGREPRPGEPLSEEQERVLHAVPESINEEPDADELIVEEAADPEAIRALIPSITFNEQEVREVLEESFDWLAEKFDSAHWKLTERQSRMIGKPTAQLLGFVWSRVSDLLPDILARWCNATPGLLDFLMVSGLIVGPKVRQQVAISRSRKRTEKQRVRPGSVAVPSRGEAAPGPVGMATSLRATPIQEAPPPN